MSERVPGEPIGVQIYTERPLDDRDGAAGLDLLRANMHIVDAETLLCEIRRDRVNVRVACAVMLFKRTGRQTLQPDSAQIVETQRAGVGAPTQDQGDLNDLGGV